MKLTYVHLLRRRERSIEEIDLFQDLLLAGQNIAGAIDAQERSFSEFLKLLDRAAEFKAWLRNANLDQNS